MVKVLIVLVTTVTIMSADAGIGQKIFKKHFRKACGFSGVKMSQLFTREGWEEIEEKQILWGTFKRICPKFVPSDKTIDKKNDLLDFMKKYSKDSNILPRC